MWTIESKLIDNEFEETPGGIYDWISVGICTIERNKRDTDGQPMKVCTSVSDAASGQPH
jgi:hypothetical protein